MNDHDLTPDLEALLADAAAGDLTPEDAERLRVAIADRPWLADLIDEQRAVAARLDPGTDPGLTDVERARLRRSVLDEVAAAPPAARPAARPQARPMPWARWAFAAAAAVVVVVVASVGLLGGRLGGDFDQIGDEVTSAPADADRAEGDDAEDATSEAAVPEADLAGGDMATEDDGATDGAEESALGAPSCPTPGRSIDDLVDRTFDDADEARSAAEAADPVAFAGEPDPIDGPDRVTWVWEDETGVVTGIVEVARAGDEWRIERAEACG